MPMKIAYGTYAMPTVPLEEAVPALAGMGYDGVEICLGPKHHRALPEDFDDSRRAAMRDLLTSNGLGIPAMFSLGHLLPKDDAEKAATQESLCRIAQLGRDLGMREPPVVAVGIGGKSADWEAVRSPLVDTLREYGELAEREDFVLAGEAHCNAAVDRVERAVWLFDTVNHPRVKLHFDIAHFFLAGDAIEHAVRSLVPLTGHTHITDARRHEDGKVELLLLGQGELDSAAYLRAMQEAGWTDFITLEVSTMVWAKPEYDPFAAARFCYASLSGAFEAAGVPRT